MTTQILFEDPKGPFYESGVVKNILGASNLVKRLGDQVTSVSISMSEAELTLMTPNVTIEDLCEVFLNKINAKDISFDPEDGTIEFDMTAPDIDLNGDEINQIHEIADYIRTNFIQAKWIEVYLFLAPLHSQPNEQEL